MVIHGEVKVTHANPTKGRIKKKGGIPEVIETMEIPLVNLPTEVIHSWAFVSKMTLI